MPTDGDTKTYNYTGSKETEDISAITDITIDRMDGADGQDSNSATGGSGGLVDSATASVSEYNTLEIWVGEIPPDPSDSSDQAGGFGRAYGGNAGGGKDSGAGGGSTEIWADSEIVTDTGIGITVSDGQSQQYSTSQAPIGPIVEMRDSNGDVIPQEKGEDSVNRFEGFIQNSQEGSISFQNFDSAPITVEEIDYHVNGTFIAAADAGGGAGDSSVFPPISQNIGSGGGARGGIGIESGQDSEGSGFGGDGGETDNDGGDGGTELGIASGGTLTEGGSTNGNGEIKLTFRVLPKFDQPLALDEKRNGKIPSVSYSKTADKMRIYRATGDNPSFPGDYTQVDEVSGTSISDYTDTGSPYDSDVHYAVVPVEGETEKSVQGFSDQYIPPQDAAEVGRN